MGSSFCPKCGTPRVGAFRFCRSCQFDFDEIANGIGVSQPTLAAPTTKALSPRGAPPAVAGTGEVRGWSTPSVSTPPVIERRKPSRWPMGLAGIGVVVVVIAAVAALAGVIPGSPLAPATNGTLFNGDGYSIVIPDTYPFVYGRVSNGDKWAADVPGLPRGITVIVAANLLPGEESLEGALGRATNSLAYAGFSVRGNPQTVSLPAGGAYRVETNNGVTAYALYERGRVFAVMLINLTREEEEAVARSLAFR